MYIIVEEASDAIVEYVDDIEEAINDANNMSGKYLVFDENANVVYDTKPGISYKF